MEETTPLFAFLLAFAIGCSTPRGESPAAKRVEKQSKTTRVAVIDADSRVGTAEDRAALFDYLLKATMEREAFSPVKNKRLGIDIEKDMRRLRGEVVGAKTERELYHALVKLSNARKDRHLRVLPIDGGLRVETYAGHPHAPIRFVPDYGKPGGYFFFVADFAENLGELSTAATPEIGDKLVGVNNRPIEEYINAVKPYCRYSTVEGLWLSMARGLPKKEMAIPPEFYGEAITYRLEKRGGKTYSLRLPYLERDKIEWHGHWKGHGDHRYRGFSQVFSTQTYDLYEHDGGAKVLLLDWYGFRENLIEDMARLVSYAEKNKRLGYAVIWDGTRSRGGSKGAYVIQRLTGKPFKTTFGNVRISDITAAFSKDKLKQIADRKVRDQGVKETVDDGTWLKQWLETDVAEAIGKGDAYSTNVPFKSAHLPKDSDGFLKPAEVHFSGPLVVWLSPWGGSHLDQFAAMVKDNGLAHLMGMSTGGYSNTWEWVEDLVFPSSGKPVVKYMWSMGHTIRPNGEILEGNPAEVDDHIPITRDNYLDYYGILIDRTLAHPNLKRAN